MVILSHRVPKGAVGWTKSVLLQTGHHCYPLHFHRADTRKSSREKISGIAVIEGIDGLHDSYVHASLEFIRRDRYSATRWNLKRYRKF